MQINFSKHDEFFEAIIEDASEIPIVAEVKKDLDDEAKEYLRVGGDWYFSLEELHILVSKGVKLNGLPSWLNIT